MNACAKINKSLVGSGAQKEKGGVRRTTGFFPEVIDGWRRSDMLRQEEDTFPILTPRSLTSRFSIAWGSN